MIKSLLKNVIFTLFFVGSVLLTGPSAFGQCGVNFRSDYRAVNKIRREMNFGYYVLHDWTGDGRSDFWNFRYNQTTQTPDIIIYPALPTGYWNWDVPIIITTQLPNSAQTDSTCCFGYLIRDFDGDSNVDLLKTSGGSPQIHRNMGNGTLAPQAPIITPGDSDTVVRHIDYADVTGDGRIDWIYALEELSNGHETISYSPGIADLSFGPTVPILAHTADNDVNDSWRILGDFDGDGDVDIAYKSFFTQDSRIRVLRNTGGGTFTLGSPQFISSLGVFSGVADFNNDGRSDIYVKDGAGITVLSAQIDGTFTTASYPLTNSSGSSRRPLDLNNDGRLDLIITSDNDYEVLLNNPAGGFTSEFHQKKLTALFPSVYLHFEDFNADGKADIFDKRHDLFNTFFEELVVIKSNVCDAKGQTRAMDFSTTPFVPDIVTWNGAAGQWRAGDGGWNAGGTVPIQSFNWGLGSLGDIPAPGDFDGDGRTDLTVYRNSDGTWYSYMSATSSWAVFNFGLPGDIPIPNDYNGGGKTDYAVFRPSDGNWYIWYMETQQYAVIHWGMNGDRPVPADFDGDGKTDIAIFRADGQLGYWYYLRSSDLGFAVVQWGLGTDVPLPADYDGDAKADLTVYRSGIWHILRTSNGVYSPVFWGTTGDIPIPFLDGGEVSVPVVYRPGNSRWYSIRYPTGWALLLTGQPIYFGLPNQ